jgi:molybdopterin converting factor small subunit
MGYLKNLFNEDEITLEVDRIRVIDLITALSGKHGGTRIDRSNTLILVDGIEVSALRGDKTEISSNDKVILVPVAHGG